VVPVRPDDLDDVPLLRRRARRRLGPGRGGPLWGVSVPVCVPTGALPAVCPLRSPRRCGLPVAGRARGGSRCDRKCAVRLKKQLRIQNRAQRPCGREFDSRRLHHPKKAGRLSGLFCVQKNPNSHRGLHMPLKGGTPRVTPFPGPVWSQISLSSLFASKAPSRPGLAISMG
jgi:hypothetical protein